MGVEAIDLLQCHDIEYGDLDQVIHETISALRRLQEKGEVRFIGVTGFPLKIFRNLLDRVQVDTIFTYCHYSLNDTTLRTLLPKLEQKQIGTINASPLSMGLLTDRGTPEWHPAIEEIKMVCAKAAAYCRERGADIAKLASQFALANPRGHTTLIGTANPENLKKNVKWLESGGDEEILTRYLKSLGPSGTKPGSFPVRSAKTLKPYSDRVLDILPWSQDGFPSSRRRIARANQSGNLQLKQPQSGILDDFARRQSLEVLCQRRGD